MRNLQGVVMPDEGKLDVDCAGLGTRCDRGDGGRGNVGLGDAGRGISVAPADTEKGEVGAR